MKCHVFIATTQGLVAVQDIELIDDPEVMSIVCLNGTAQSLNISTAYHNFVKKGSGIIQKDFNGQSYRIDVSDNIEHGNSWQLGFYIAHFLESIDLLGDGVPNENDEILCLTGEINIKNKSVKNVTHIATKLVLAKNQITTWQDLGFDVKFLLPVQNSFIDELDQYKACCIQVADIEQAISQLPAINKGAIKNTKLIKQAAIDFKKISPHNYGAKNKKSLFLIVCSVLLLLFIIYTQTNLDKNTQQKANGNHQDNKAKVVKISPYLIAYVRQKTYLNKDEKKCDDSLSTNRLDLINGRFKTLEHAKLCQLLFITPENTKQVIMFTRYKKELINLKSEKKTWPIKIPSSLSNDLYYLLLPLSTFLTDAKIASLNNEIKHLKGPVTVASISPILKRLSINERLLQHKIMTF
ncbi:hypothetical protein CJF42_06680 [Pseudoalteromonas sp. NBT06-2]|uniref:hypothetical protein n=1 Tax=Pseudoalteromonas sp. NBT06-2 TaxID=2025950 RepID=UPI000BA67937|nr:hypothetical protein [Pseudoalteromonas sp. NBT06-2]PAJ75170.1 hypothetical protein CJF42_06680 [Pseudoalteromonas sp. NBT06-2]